MLLPKYSCYKGRLADCYSSSGKERDITLIFKGDISRAIEENPGGEHFLVKIDANARTERRGEVGGESDHMFSGRARGLL